MSATRPKRSSVKCICYSLAYNDEDNEDRSERDGDADGDGGDSGVVVRSRLDREESVDSEREDEYVPAMEVVVDGTTREGDEEVEDEDEMMRGCEDDEEEDVKPRIKTKGKVNTGTAATPRTPKKRPAMSADDEDDNQDVDVKPSLDDGLSPSPSKKPRANARATPRGDKFVTTPAIRVAIFRELCEMAKPSSSKASIDWDGIGREQGQDPKKIKKVSRWAEEGREGWVRLG
jgi:hypothetical protein